MKTMLTLTACCLMILLLSMCNRKGMGLGIGALRGKRDSAHRPSVILDTGQVHMKVLYCQLTAKSADDIGRLLNAGYERVCNQISRHRLSCGRTMAFYYSYQEPYVFDAAIEVDSIPPLLEDTTIRSRELKGQVLIAHYKGEYEKASLAYKAIWQWMLSNGRKPGGQPFEIYLNDPVTTKDHSKLLTDIYQLLQ